MAIQYLDGRRLKKVIVVGSHKVIETQDHLNEINVFPVPDGDTGSNMASTFESISRGAMDCENDDLSAVSEKLADSAMNGARGNSGAILAQFFQGLAQSIGDKSQVTLEQFSHAVSHASKSARAAISNPVEGTIITVMNDWSDWIKKHWHKFDNFENLLGRSLEVAKQSLRDTPKKLEVLSKAKVVDAGAQGFVNFLQGIQDFITTGKAGQLSLQDVKQKFSSIKPRQLIQNVVTSMSELNLSAYASHREELDFQYCTECIMHSQDMDLDQIKQEASFWGNSLVVVGNAKKVKIHIHSNDPERFFNKMSDFGELLETKADDMWAQYRARINWQNPQHISLVMDSSCILPREFVAKHNIISFPMQIMINNQAYLDRINISHERFIQELANDENQVSTSQPIPADITKAFDKALRHTQNVIAITLSASLSGTYESTATQAKHYDQSNIEIFDAKTVAAGLGLIVQVAAEAIHAGQDMDEVKRRIEYVIQHNKSFVSPKTLKYFIRGGRVSKPAGLLAKLFGLLPILGVDEDGRASTHGVALGRRGNRKKTLKLALDYAKTVKNPRFIIAHVGADKAATKYAEVIKHEIGIEDIPVVAASPLLITHSGPGTIAISVFGFQPGDEIF